MASSSPDVLFLRRHLAREHSVFCLLLAPPLGSVHFRFDSHGSHFPLGHLLASENISFYRCLVVASHSGVRKGLSETSSVGHWLSRLETRVRLISTSARAHRHKVLIHLSTLSRRWRSRSRGSSLSNCRIVQLSRIHTATQRPIHQSVGQVITGGIR